MDTIRQILYKIGLLLAFLSAFAEAGAQTKTQMPQHFPRRALVAPDCYISNIIEVVKVGAGTKDLSHVMDADLTNYATVIGVVNAALLENPTIRIKDTKRIYQPGTEAGFCVQTGGNLLSLDLLKVTNIGFYRDNKLLATKKVEDANNTNLLNLGLIQIPGDTLSVRYLTVKAPTVDEDKDMEGGFDEIALFVGGVSAEVSSLFNIYYGFVGDAYEFALTTKNFPDHNLSYDVRPLGTINQENLIDADTTNHVPFVKFLGDMTVVTLKWDQDKMFKAGTQVGFFYKDINVVDVGIGHTTKVNVTDTRMGITDEVLISSQVLNVTLFGAGWHKVSIRAPRDFNQVTLEIGGGGVELGGRQLFYAFVSDPPVVEHTHDLNVNMNAYLGKDVTDYTMFASKKSTWKLIAKPTDETGTLTLTASDERPSDGLRSSVMDGLDNTTKLEESAQITAGGKEGNYSCTLSGMTPDVKGSYVIAVEAVDCHCKDTIILTRGNVPGLDAKCDDVLHGENIELSTQTHQSSGSLLSWSSVKNKELIIDDNPDTYAEYTGGLGLASNLMLVGVKTKDGSNLYKEETGGESPDTLKVGFLMETAMDVLNADVLQFFQIRLYKNGVEVLHEVVKNTDVIGVGLAGGNRTSKTRFGIDIPEDTAFDEMQLWKSGVLSLDFSTVRIYGSYISSNKLRCYEDPLACGSTPISPETTGAYYNYDHTGFMGVAQIGGAMTNLEQALKPNIYDDFASIGSGVSVASPWFVSVKLGKVMDRTKQACVVIDQATYVAGLKVAGSMRVELYLTGVKAAVTTMDKWGVLNLNAIGYGDKEYLFVTPTSSYDEIRFSWGGLAGVDLGQVKLYGFAVREDLNGNGIADCIESPPFLNITTTQDICVGEELIITGGGPKDAVYEVACPQIGIGAFKKPATEGGEGTGGEPAALAVEPSLDDIIGEWVEQTIDEKGEINWNLGAVKQPCEEAKIYIRPKDKDDAQAPALYVSVHPNRTKWIPQADGNARTGWNTWANWDRGTPWACTDVIVPTDADVFPILKRDEQNACRYIHFEPHAEVVNTQWLSYKQAWVEMLLQPNRYYMVTVPLKETRSGDWFIRQQLLDANQQVKLYPDTFVNLNEATYKANRIVPTIYQRIWERVAYHKSMNGAALDVYPATTRWTTPANMLNWSYDLLDTDIKKRGAALSVWVHPGKPAGSTPVEGETPATPTDPAGNTDPAAPAEGYRFRFPKEHRVYYYFDPDGNQVENLYVYTNRGKGVGRFIYEAADSTVTFPVRQKVRNEGYANKTYLFANPFMAHIDMKEFLRVNRHILSVKVYNGENGSQNTLIRDKDDEGNEITEGFISTKPEDYKGENEGKPSAFLLAPMQSFFAVEEVDPEDREDEFCEVQFTQEMLCSGAGTNQTGNHLRSASAVTDDRSIRLQAESGDYRSRALLHFATTARDGFAEGEDSETLIDEADREGISLFTIAGEKALDIQQRRSGGAIPLGFHVGGDAARELTLRLTLPGAYEGWTLEDLETGMIYPLEAGCENRLELGRLTSNVGRFYLRGGSPTANERIAAAPAKVYAYREEGGTVVIRSVDGMMRRCETFTLSGRRVSVAAFESDEYRLPGTNGVLLIKVCLMDGREERMKIMGW